MARGGVNPMAKINPRRGYLGRLTNIHVNTLTSTLRTTFYSMMKIMITTHVKEGVRQQDTWLRSWLKSKIDEVVGCILSSKIISLLFEISYNASIEGNSFSLGVRICEITVSECYS